MLLYVHVVTKSLDLVFLFIVAKDESFGGTYEGVDPMGLLASMRPIPGSRTGLR